MTVKISYAARSYRCTHRESRTARLDAILTHATPRARRWGVADREPMRACLEWRHRRRDHTAFFSKDGCVYIPNFTSPSNPFQNLSPACTFRRAIARFLHRAGKSARPRYSTRCANGAGRGPHHNTPHPPPQAPAPRAGLRPVQSHMVISRLFINSKSVLITFSSAMALYNAAK